MSLVAQEFLFSFLGVLSLSTPAYGLTPGSFFFAAIVSSFLLSAAFSALPFFRRAASSFRHRRNWVSRSFSRLAITAWISTGSSVNANLLSLSHERGASMVEPPVTVRTTGVAQGFPVAAALCRHGLQPLRDKLPGDALVLLVLNIGRDSRSACWKRAYFVVLAIGQERNQPLLCLGRHLWRRWKAARNLAFGLCDFLSPHCSERVGELCHQREALRIALSVKARRCRTR